MHMRYAYLSKQWLDLCLVFVSPYPVTPWSGCTHTPHYALVRLSNKAKQSKSSIILCALLCGLAATVNIHNVSDVYESDSEQELTRVTLLKTFHIYRWSFQKSRLCLWHSSASLWLLLLWTWRYCQSVFLRASNQLADLISSQPTQVCSTTSPVPLTRKCNLNFSKSRSFGKYSHVDPVSKLSTQNLRPFKAPEKIVRNNLIILRSDIFPINLCLWIGKNLCICGSGSYVYVQIQGGNYLVKESILQL